MMKKALLTTGNDFVKLNNLKQELLLKSYLRKTSNHFICLNNVALAERLCRKIFTDHQCGSDKYIFEASPGYGVLTEQLLKHSTGKVRVFEHIQKQRSHLEELRQKFHNRLEIVDQQILDFSTGNYKLLNIDRSDFLRNCFQNLSINWGQNKPENSFESSYIFFAALSPFLAREFVTYLVYSVVRFESFFESGPNEFYLFIPVSLFKSIVSRPSKNLNLYTAFTIHMNTLFNFEEVDLYSNDLEGVEKIKIDQRYYSIISGTNFDYTNDRTFKSKEGFVLFKFKPKAFISHTETDLLIDYVFFVKQSFMKRTNNAIKYYEKLFPGSTIDLLGLGISYFKTMGDLTSDEMFKIFNHLYQLPYFQNSIFKEH